MNWHVTQNTSGPRPNTCTPRLEHTCCNLPCAWGLSPTVWWLSPPRNLTWGELRLDLCVCASHCRARLSVATAAASALSGGHSRVDSSAPAPYTDGQALWPSLHFIFSKERCWLKHPEKSTYFSEKPVGIPYILGTHRLGSQRGAAWLPPAGSLFPPGQPNSALRQVFCGQGEKH